MNASLPALFPFGLSTESTRGGQEVTQIPPTHPIGVGSAGGRVVPRILVVDDDESVVLFLASALGANGTAAISVASDARRAVSLYHRVQPDLVLLDLHLGDGAPLGLLPELAIPADDFVPVVVLTGDRGAESRQHALRAGVAELVTKPITAGELRLRVSNLLRMRAMHVRLRSQNVELEARVQEQLAHRQCQLADRRARTGRVVELVHSRSVTMHYQPIVDVDDGTIVAVEALARFGGRFAGRPDRWFAEAAELGLGAHLEVIAVTAALDGITELPPSVFVAVNCSPATAVSPLLLDPLVSVAPGRVVLELTEHAHVDDYDRLHEALGRVRARGVRVAVDDTGGGFASLQHILNLRPEIIKLDREVTRGIDGDPVQRALASSLVAFAHEIDAQIIATGVECQGELTTLRKIGIRYAQGHHVGRPGPLPLAASRVALDDDGRALGIDRR